MSIRERWALLCDLMAGIRWWVDYGDGDEELTMQKLDGRAGLVRAYCPIRP